MSDRRNTGRQGDRRAGQTRQSGRDRRRRARARKKRVRILILVVVLLALVLGAVLLKGKGLFGGTGAEAGTETESVTGEETASEAMSSTTEEVTPEAGESTPAAASEASAEEGTEAGDAGGTGSNSGSNGGSGSSGGGSGSTGSGTGKAEAVSFPYTLPNQSIQLVSLASYDGIYFEDGSDKEAKDVALLTLKNTGSRPVEFLQVSFQSSDVEYHFEGSAIPAGATVVMQEKDRKGCRKGKYTDVKVELAEMASMEMHEDKVKVEDLGDDRLAVTNLSGAEIPTVRVFYKLYMAEEKTYVGGITYNAKITGLKAGETREIAPSHFVSGSGRIMMVRLYDTVQ